MPSYYSYGFRDSYDLVELRRAANKQLEAINSGSVKRQIERERDMERNRKKAAREKAMTKRIRIREIKLKLKILRSEVADITPVWEEMMALYEKHGASMGDHSDYTYGVLEETDHLRDTKLEKIYDLEQELADLKWEC